LTSHRVHTLPPNPQILSLRHNRLTGTIPPELGRLSQLKTLYMEKNQLCGTIPDTLANLASLEELNLLGNQFQGGNKKLPSKNRVSTEDTVLQGKISTSGAFCIVAARMPS